MLEDYQRALEPQSIVELVPEEILRSLMQGFFFGNRAGMVLIYDDGRDENGEPILKRLEPVDTDGEDRREQFVNFNPFCAKFRETPERNTMCENCDTKHALAEFAHTRKERRYRCHMGLIDMTIPIKVNDQTRGVIFGGQRIIRGDEQMLHRIRGQIKEKAPDIHAELEQALETGAQDAILIDAFENGFVKFAEAMQTTVNAYIEAKRGEAERQALLELGEQLGRSLPKGADGSSAPISDLCSELQALFKNSPVWVLQRHGSRYECNEASPLAIGTIPVSVPVQYLITTPLEEVTYLEESAPLAIELKHKLRTESVNLSLVRCDTAISENEVASVILVIGSHVREQQAEIVLGCARALADRTGVMLLFQRLSKQQQNFARAAAFTGHHLKTPLQAALLSIHEARHGMSETDNSELADLLSDVENQILLGMADALRLQDAALTPAKEEIDLIQLIESVCDYMEPVARRRQIRFRIVDRVKTRTCVIGVPFHLRIALLNLVDNAIKYSYENKYIELRYSTIATNRKAGRQQQYIAIEIEDFGVGFPEEEKDRLFGLGIRLQETKGRHFRPGGGIGLLQAKEYIEGAGGSLDIHIEHLPVRPETRGTLSKVTVIIHLPIASWMT